uniref:Uncharacterized protein n=1 Tax=Meloidogyne hapla TaxID=6305 RepID=A0A1I8BAQ6_MELHA
MPKSHQQQQQKAPAPPALPPPNLSLLSFVRRNEEEMPNGWQRRPSTITTPNRKEEINEKEWKEKIKFKQRNNKTKLLLFGTPQLGAHNWAHTVGRRRFGATNWARNSKMQIIARSKELFKLRRITPKSA